MLLRLQYTKSPPVVSEASQHGEHSRLEALGLGVPTEGWGSWLAGSRMGSGSAFSSLTVHVQLCLWL